MNGEVDKMMTTIAQRTNDDDGGNNSDAGSSVSSISCGSFEELKPIPEITNAALNDDKMAELLSAQMHVGTGEKNSLALVETLAHRAGTIQTIKWYGRHLPRCVLEQCGNGIMSDKYGGSLATTSTVTANSLEANERAKESRDGYRIPYAEDYQAALLFIDISGFTALSVLLDIETLSVTINSYFQMICDIVISHGGDILKFAGDALYAEWRSEPVTNTNCRGNSRMPRTSSVKTNIEQCVTTASSCGAAVVAKCSDYPVYRKVGRVEEQVANLNVHCGLGFGKLTGVQLGDDLTRNEYLIVGDPIDQVAKAEKLAPLGDLFISPEALVILRKTCTVTVKQKEANSPLQIASRRKKLFSERRRRKQKVSSVNTIEALSRMCEKNMQMDCLQKLKTQISLYVHPVIVKSELAKVGKVRVRDHEKNTVQERHRAEAELRSVYTIFITPMIKLDKNTTKAGREKLHRKLNDILKLVSNVLDQFVGHLRQFIVDDKGAVLIGTFGLRGSTTPNMIAERALPATRLIHQLLKTELGVDNKIGGTFGKAYCGVVGGIDRHEFAILGPSVNLAARLMAQKDHPGILVDDAVRLKAGQAFIFRHLKAVKAKGYSDPVPVFEPLNARESRWGKLNPRFVGRKAEVRMVCKLVTEMSAKRGPAKMFFIWGDSASGKSAVVVRTIAVVSKILLTRRKKAMISRNISNEGDRLVPYSLLRSVFEDVLHELEEPKDDASTKVDSTSHAGMSYLEKDWDKMSLDSKITMSSAVTGNNVRVSALKRLKYVCEELNAPEGYFDIVGHHLIGLSNSAESGGKVDNLDEVEDFIVEVFKHCTNHLDLVVLAMDDVQFMDNKSWAVLNKMFKACDNVLMLCGSRPVTSNRLTIDDSFWANINGKYKEENRITEVELGPLERRSIIELISKSLNCNPKEVDDGFGTAVYNQSGGMPYFASEILDNLTREKRCKRLKNRKIGCFNTNFGFAKLDELILHRLDKIDERIRQILQISAILDTTFFFWEIQIVFEHLNSIPLTERSSAIDMIKEALDSAIREGILEEVFDFEDDELNGQELNSELTKICAHSEKEHSHGTCQNMQQRQYRFFHDTWKRNVHSLLLDSRKKDIHRYAATALEKIYTMDSKGNYRSKLKVFGHWKSSGNITKAANLAHEIGRSFAKLGLVFDAIRMYDDAINMWRPRDENIEEEEELIGGFEGEVLDSLDADDVLCLIKLHIAKGQAYGSVTSVKESADAFQNGLTVLRAAPAANELTDRSFAFPLFSGLFFLMKYGILVEPGQEIAFEQELVANFVSETERHGDPVHHTRALAMQVEMFTRIGKFQDGIKCHDILSSIYDPDKHSAGVCEAYGSDRAAQSFAMLATCHILSGDVEKALEVSHHIVDELLPKMDIKNVHNSCILFYASLWIMKDHGHAPLVQKTFIKYVKEPFDTYFGKDGRTPCLHYFKPICVLLDLKVHEDSTLENLQEHIDWVRNEENFESIQAGVDRAMLKFGRCKYAIFAEILMMLSKQVDDQKLIEEFITRGLRYARECIERAEGIDGTEKQLFSLHNVKHVYETLQELESAT